MGDVMIVLFSLTAVAALALGLAGGLVGCYIYACKPLLADIARLTELIADMKKQGFVRNYTFEQATKPDPSANIREY